MSECLIGGRHDGTIDSTHSRTLKLSDGDTHNFRCRDLHSEFPQFKTNQKFSNPVNP